MIENLKKEIEIGGENVFHYGELDNSGTHFRKVGEINGDQWLVYYKKDWFIVEIYSEIINIKDIETEDFFEKFEFKEIFKFYKTDVGTLEDFFDGHTEEAINFYQSTIK